MAVIADTCPREDRTPERRVFQDLSDSTARIRWGEPARRAAPRTTTARPAASADLALARSGESPVQVAEWVGHAKASLTLDVYGHVLVGGELSPSRLVELLGLDPERYLPAESRLGDDAVMTRNGHGTSNPDSQAVPQLLLD
jgi:hypothetical protein